MLSAVRPLAVNTRTDQLYVKRHRYLEYYGPSISVWCANFGVIDRDEPFERKKESKLHTFTDDLYCEGAVIRSMLFYPFAQVASVRCLAMAGARVEPGRRSASANVLQGVTGDHVEFNFRPQCFGGLGRA